MPEQLAKYSFLPWMRTGLGNEITETDLLGSNPGNNAVAERPQVQVQVKVEALKDGNRNTGLPQISKTVKIQGPGDVLGIHARQVIRVHPKPGVDNFETNNLAYIEFYEEDLPWRFTPAKPTDNKLRPWISLILCTEEEFTRNTQGGTPTPYITLERSALPNVFFNEQDLHFLAHVHVLEQMGETDISSNTAAAAALSNTLSRNPDQALSRIICPRKLKANTEYFAFLIPAYETGRLAGLGEDTGEVKAQKASWTWQSINAASHPVKYPYYYLWSFKTGSFGDFESLATKLEARSLPTDFGRREMDLTNIGYGITPNVNQAKGYIEGAMMHANYATVAVNGGLKNQIRSILNLSADLQAKLPIVPQGQFFYSPNIEIDPIITPPTYGKWHAFVSKLENKNDWVHQLNLHPTHRAAAGLGTRVVQENQEKFMEMAWAQIGAINEANQKIRENELVRRVADYVYCKNVKPLAEFELVNTVGSAMGILKGNNQTLTAQKSLKDSKVPTAIKSGAFTKIANNFTQTALMNPQGIDGANLVMNNNLLNRANATGDISVIDPVTQQAKTVSPVSPAPVRFEPPGIINPVMAFHAIEYVVLNPPPTFFGRLTTAIAAAGTNFTTQGILNAIPAFVEAERQRATAILNAINLRTLSGDQLDLRVSASVFDERISNQFTESIYDTTAPQIKKVRFFKQVTQSGTFTPVILMYAVVLQAREEYKTSFQHTFLTQTNSGTLAGKIFRKPELSILQIPTLRDTIIHRFDPLQNFRRKINNFIQADTENKSKPLMAYPRFPFPAYDYLKGISPDYIIPNISDIPPDTITLMVPNKKFIESFLTGMNHEFSRELLWREFPTDMRGSYFRHFWEYDNDPNQELFPLANETEAEFNERIIAFQNSRSDIKEMHTWNGSALGNNHMPGGAGLVLLVKGDLFKKYPGTLVYAQKGKARAGASASSPPRDLADYHNPNNVKWPVITGNIEPDVYFFGFELTDTEAGGDPGWFFVLRERPGEISFGLDDLNGTLATPPNSWDAMTWQHLTNNAQTEPKHLLIKNAPAAINSIGNISWNENSAHTAYILYQNPVLFARHASTML